MDTLGGLAGRWAHQGTGAHVRLGQGMPAPAPQWNLVSLCLQASTGQGAGAAELEGYQIPAVLMAGLGTSWLFRLFSPHKTLWSPEHYFHFTNGKTRCPSAQGRRFTCTSPRLGPGQLSAPFPLPLLPFWVGPHGQAGSPFQHLHL